jgi:hypothetical protein
MSKRFFSSFAALLLGSNVVGVTHAKVLFSGEKKLNNVVSDLLEVSSISGSSKPFSFSRSTEGWIFISSACKGSGTVTVTLDSDSKHDSVIIQDSDTGAASEGMRFVTQGQHTIQVECKGKVRVDNLVVKSIPELVHCGLGFDPQIKSYGHYDMEFLKKDILPNVSTLIIPHNLKLEQRVIDDWQRQGKRFVAETGVNSQAKTAEEHYKHWSGFFETAPFLDGIIIDEFIINNPSTRPGVTISPERQKRMDEEQQRHQTFGEALKQVRADERFKNKMVYAYFGGSGKKLNQEMIGTNFVRTILDCGYRIALERYLHEMSSEKGSKEALQNFIDGIEDWEAKKPGVKKKMIIAFGLFSMPRGD